MQARVLPPQLRRKLIGNINDILCFLHRVQVSCGQFLNDDAVLGTIRPGVYPVVLPGVIVL